MDPNLNDAVTEAWIDGLQMMDDEAFFNTIIHMIELQQNPQGAIVEKAQRDAENRKMDEAYLEELTKTQERSKLTPVISVRNAAKRRLFLQVITFRRIVEKNEREKLGIVGGSTALPGFFGGYAMSYAEILATIGGGRRKSRTRKNHKSRARKSRKNHKSARKNHKNHKSARKSTRK